MEFEVVGICVKFENNDLIILDDDNDLININKSFFTKKDKEMIQQSFIDKRVSFYYSVDLYKNGILFDIIEISENDKQTCLCHNHIQGNYNLTTIRLFKSIAKLKSLV
jgi:hypothetical protein